jgi:trigger factor
MDVKIEELPKSKVQIKINLTGEELSPSLVIGVGEISKNLNIPGFRPGKVPPKIVEEKVGKGKILEEAAKIALNKVFPKIVSDNKLEILGSPEAKIEKLSEEVFIATIEVAVFPKVKLPAWQEIARTEPQKEIKVEKKEVEDSLRHLQKSRAKYIKSLEPVTKGNQVTIDYEIRSGGVKIENGDIRDQKLILGEGKLIPGFEENLIGMRESEERNFSLLASSNFWQKELQGKSLDFKVRMKEIFKVELPKMNDDFVHSLGEFKDLENLQKSLLEGIEIEKKQEEEKRWQNSVLEKIGSQAEIDLPDILIENERDQMIENLKKKIEEMGLSFEIYLSRLKKSPEELKRDFLPEAEKKVRIFLCLYEIARAEKIEVDEKEVEEEINKIIKNYPDLISRFKGDEEEKLKNYIRENLLQKKVIELLLSKARD